MSSCDTSHVVWKNKNIFYLAFDRKIWPKPCPKAVDLYLHSPQSPYARAFVLGHFDFCHVLLYVCRICITYVHVWVLSCFGHLQLFATQWTLACQAPLSTEFSRQEYRGGLLCFPPGDLPDPGTKFTSLLSPALAGRFFTTSAAWEAPWLGTHRF